MTLRTFGERLDGAAAILLDPRVDPDRSRAAAESLYAACADHVPMLDTTPTPLPSGKALSPADAARCVLDYRRTACYLQAAAAAVETALARWRPRPLRVLYAGCGPFAPLVLPLARRYSAARLEFILVDVHPDSIAAATLLFERAGVRASLRRAICADASTLQLPPHERAHVLIAELMQRALSREPQLEVMLRLRSQIVDEALIVPHRIAVVAALARIAHEQRTDVAVDRLALGALLDISTETVAALSAQLSVDPRVLSPVQLRVPDDAPSGLNLMLRTQIETWPGIVLEDYDSGLTYPLFVHELGEVAAGSTLQFRYRLGGDPGFECHVLKSNDQSTVNLAALPPIRL